MHPRCRVLIVEDEAVISMMIEDMVLDVNVRGTMVFDLADAIRSVFATGYGSHVSPDRFKDAPVLEKPFTFDALREALNQALAGSACDTGSH